MQVLLQSLGFGIAVAFIVLGLIGTIVRLFPARFDLVHDADLCVAGWI